MNPFYELPRVVQWLIAVPMFCFAVLVWVTFFELTDKSSFWNLSIFIVIPITTFFSTPIMKLVGLGKYFSPMLLVDRPSKKKYALHNGTTFDYLLVMRKTNPGIEWQNKMLSYFLEGLLAIIEKIEAGKLPDTVLIKGSSYFFSRKSAERLGFRIQRPSLFVRLYLTLSILDLTLMYSLAKGKFAIPNVLSVRKAVITGKELVEQKDKLENLLSSIEARY